MSDIYQLPTSTADNFLNLNISKSQEILLENLVIPDELVDTNAKLNPDLTLPLSPLMVYEKDGRYNIIDGCKRYHLARQHQYTTCYCNIVSSTHGSANASFLRIAMNLKRQLSFTEKYLYLFWLKSNLSNDKYLNLSDHITTSPKERYDIEQIFGSSSAILLSIEQSNLDLSIAPELLAIKNEDQDYFLSFFSKLQFSRSMQREILEWVPEIAFRNSISVQRVLESSSIQEVLNHKTMNSPQKMQKIRDSLFTDRFPVLVDAKNEWTAYARKINPDPGHIQFLGSEGFEKNRLEIKITISNANEALLIFDRFKNISSEEWEKLIYPAKNFCRVNPEK